MKYVTHLVADVHQPLHAGFADDRGGNNYQLQAFGRGTNLHAVWDSALIRNWPGGEQALRTAVNTEMARSVAHETAARWAEESCAIVLAPGFYPEGHQLAPTTRSAGPRPGEALAIAAHKGSATVLNKPCQGDEADCSVPADHARRGQTTHPQDEPVDGPCRVRGLTTAPRNAAYGLTRFACRTARFL